MKLFSSLIIIFALFSACKPPQEQEVTQAQAYSTDNLPSRWASSNVFPLNLKISNDFDSTESDAIAASANAWNDGLDQAISFFNTENANLEHKEGLNNYNDSLYGVYKIFDWPESLPGTALAVTQIEGIQYSSYIQITHADILLNYDYFSFTVNGGWGYDLQTVVVHEMGHFLGLYHDNSSVNESVMYPTISRYYDNPVPKNKDLSNLANKYGLNNNPANHQLTSLSHLQNSGTPVTIQLELHADHREIMRVNGKVFEIKH